MNYSNYGDANFTISKVRMFAGSHNIQVPNKYALIRNDTNDVLGVVGERYKVVQHKDMIDNQREVIELSGLNTDNIKENITVARRGARCFVKHTLPDHFITTPDGDTAELTFLGTNSYDGFFSFILSAGARQGACMNGQVWTKGAATIYKQRHNKKLSLEAAGAVVYNALELFKEEGERWRRWYATPVNNLASHIIFAKASGLTTNQLKDNKLNRNYLYLKSRYESHYRDALGRNLWGVYNTLTDWSTHAPTNKNTDMNNIKYLRTQKVSEVINEFDDIALAV